MHGKKQFNCLNILTKFMNLLSTTMSSAEGQMLCYSNSTLTIAEALSINRASNYYPVGWIAEVQRTSSCHQYEVELQIAKTWASHTFHLVGLGSQAATKYRWCGFPDITCIIDNFALYFKMELLKWAMSLCMIFTILPDLTRDGQCYVCFCPVC